MRANTHETYVTLRNAIARIEKLENERGERMRNGAPIWAIGEGYANILMTLRAWADECSQ